MAKTLTLNNEEYEVIPPHTVQASKVIADMHELLGRPGDPYTTSGRKMMEIILSVWQDLDPVESKRWFDARSEYQESELSIKEQVHKGTGRSLASIPTPVYRMMQKVFPSMDLSSRDGFIKLVKEYPIFRMANKV